MPIFIIMCCVATKQRLLNPQHVILYSILCHVSITTRNFSSLPLGRIRDCWNDESSPVVCKVLHHLCMNPFSEKITLFPLLQRVTFLPLSDRIVESFRNWMKEKFLSSLWLPLSFGRKHLDKTSGGGFKVISGKFTSYLEIVDYRERRKRTCH